MFSKAEYVSSLTCNIFIKDKKETVESAKAIVDQVLKTSKKKKNKKQGIAYLVHLSSC